MHTFGAIVLAVVGIVIMQAVLWLIALFLFVPMYNSVGMILPSILLFAFSGSAYYGGLIFALGLVPKSNAKVVGWTIGALVLIGTGYGAIKNFQHEPFQVTVLALIVGFGALLGTIAASATPRSID